MKTTKVFKTEENTILIVTASTEGCNGRQYVSVTANEVEPIKKSEAIKRNRESLEDGELWRMAVEAKSTELGLTDWVDFVIGTDGELGNFDNSLYSDDLTIDGEDYIFDSRSCGCLHDDIKKATKIFNKLIKMHLSEEDVKEAERLISNIKADDIDHEVERCTREILGLLV